MRRAVAFCPGHITGFFQIVEHDNVFETGSRGAGFCTELGARLEVWMTDGEGTIEVTINGNQTFAPVTEHALRRLLRNEPLRSQHRDHARPAPVPGLRDQRRRRAIGLPGTIQPSGASGP